MEQRYKTMGAQLGKKIANPGAHMPSAAVGLIRKRRTKKEELSQRAVGGSRVKPIKEYNPFPVEFSPGSL